MRWGKCTTRTALAVLSLLLVFAAGCAEDAAPITQVKVWDKDFQELNTITDAEQLNALIQLWADRTTASEHPQFTHKVDIATADRSVRWLYHPDGYATVLSMKARPIYRIRDPEKLNKILIPEQRPSNE